MDNLTGLLFSREKVIATQLLIMMVKGSYNIQRRELISSICITSRVHGVHKNVTQYSPAAVFQRFSTKTNELSLALNFSYSWHKAN